MRILITGAGGFIGRKLTERFLASGSVDGQKIDTITAADVSMSIDNVVAVAAIARDNTTLLVFGLALSIGLMAFCATMVMRLLTRYPWITWLGLAFLVYLAADMLFTGWPDMARYLGLGGLLA